MSKTKFPDTDGWYIMRIKIEPALSLEDSAILESVVSEICEKSYYELGFYKYYKTTIKIIYRKKK